MRLGRYICAAAAKRVRGLFGSTMFGLSFWEITVVLVVALVVLGPKRLPELARTLGGALRTLRRASSDIRSALDEPLREMREPLEEIRQDLYQTVHHFEEQVERALDREESAVRHALVDEPPALAAAKDLHLPPPGDDVERAVTGDGSEGVPPSDEDGRVAVDVSAFAAVLPAGPPPGSELAEDGAERALEAPKGEVGG